MKVIMNIKLARFFEYLLTVEDGSKVGYSNINTLKYKYDNFLFNILSNINNIKKLDCDGLRFFSNMESEYMNDMSDEEKYKIYMSGDIWVYGEIRGLDSEGITKLKETIKTIYIYAVSELDTDLIFDSSDDFVEWNNKLKSNSLPLTFMQLYIEKDSLIRLRPKFELDRDLDIGYLTVEEEVDTNRKLIKEIIELNIQIEKDDNRRSSLQEFFNS